MKRSFVSLLSLSLTCVGLAYDGSVEGVSTDAASTTPAQATVTPGKGVFSGFVQEQYFATDQATKASGLFRNRRTRLNYTHQIDEKFLGRFSVELAAGSNQATAQVRDAFIQYRPNKFGASSGPVLTFGQQNLPLGYEISYSSSQRTWPERSVYEQTYFGGERGKGFVYQNGSATNYWYVGAMNSLTVNDPEQAESASKGEVGPIAGIRGKLGFWEGGISTFSSKRPSYSSGSLNLTTTDRQFTYFDLRYHPTHSKFDVRSEFMVGKDRIPQATTSAGTKVQGFHVNVDYKVNAEDSVVLRYENFDRDTDVSGNVQNLYGLAFVKDVNSSVRLTLATDWNKNPTNPSGQTSYRTFTFRVQFRF